RDATSTLRPYPTRFRSRPYGRIVTGVDASEPAQRGLRVAAEETRLRGGVLRVIHVLPDSHGLQLAVAAGARPEALADEVRGDGALPRSEEHTSELQSRENLVC